MPLGGGEGGAYDTAVDAILSATERLFSSMGNAQEMVRQAKILAEATSSLVNAIKLEAENETDPGGCGQLKGVWLYGGGEGCILAWMRS